MIQLTRAQRKALADVIAYRSAWRAAGPDGRVAKLAYSASRARMLRRLRMADLLTACNEITNRGRWALEGNE